MFYSNERNTFISPSMRDCSGAYLIDRSGAYFEPIINYLRTGKLIMDHHLNPIGNNDTIIF